MRNTYSGLIVAMVVGAALILVNLGGFGMWEPHETDRVEIAEALLAGEELPHRAAPGVHLEERMAAVSWSALGKTELSSRLPVALMALMAIAALFLTLVPLTGARVATFAALALASAPALLFHGRQLTSGMPLLLGEILAFGGLALAAWGSKRVHLVAGALVAAGGLVLGWLAGGLLMGVAVPLGAIALALGFNGDVAAIFSSKGDPIPRSRQVVFFVAASAAVVATAAYFAVAVFFDGDMVLVTGGLEAKASKPKTFEFALEQLAYGWFPWSVLVPLLAMSYFRGDGESGGRPVAALVAAGLTVGYVAQTFFVSYHGIAPLFLALPMTAGAALAVADLESRKEPGRLSALIGVVLLVILIRDFAQRPETILMGFGFEKIPVPKDFAPIIPAALFGAPVGVLCLVLGFFASGGEEGGRWLKLRSVVLVPVAAAAFGGYVSFVLVPGLAVDLSSKYAVETYKKYSKGGEPLGVYGPSRFLGDAEKLPGRDDVVSWLERSERVFALFPPKELAEVNRRFRKKTGRHVFVLDATSDRYVLATSKPAAGEKSSNPVLPFLRSEPFKPGPANALEVNFDDKITFLGWEVEGPGGKPKLANGKKATFTTYWRCDGKLSKDYEIFMHIDGPGGRIHGDHKVLEEKYSTRKWEPGDYIKDVYKKKIPVYQKTGRYSVRLGMYKGSKRLKIKDTENVKENSLLITHLEVE